MLVEALPPVLVLHHLHLKRFLYVAADGIVKLDKPVQFAPELETSLGAINRLCFPGAR